MEKRIKLEKAIGGLHFVAEVPRANKETDAVEAKHLIAMEKWMMRKLCEFGKPTPDGLQFLRTRSRLKATDLAALIDVTPETISRWENGKNDIPGSAWELVVTLAEEHVDGRSDTLGRLRERHERREHPPARISMKPADMTA